MSVYVSHVPGAAKGELLVLSEPLSFWGGLDPTTGKIIDHNHPQVGLSVANRIMAMPHGRGSSSASSVLAEAMRLGNAPAGIVLGEADPILVMGSLVGSYLYEVHCPILVGELPTPLEGNWSISEGDLLPPGQD